MIISENLTILGRELVKRYSDSGYYIRQDQTGIDYSEAIDVAESEFTYTETDIPIEDPDEATETEQKAAAFDYITGRSDGNA